MMMRGRGNEFKRKEQNDDEGVVARTDVKSKDMDGLSPDLLQCIVRVQIDPL